LHEGDLITAIEGEPVEGPQDLADAIAEYQPGDLVTLTVSQLDEDEERKVEVTLAEHPEKDGVAYLGVHIGSFIHVHRSEDGDEHSLELEMFLDVPFDESHMEHGDEPYHFEFHFPPEYFEGVGTNCCSEGV
jgi:hypothetical protein